MLDPDSLDYAKGGGTVTVVAQDDRTGRVLMVAAADREAIARTVETGEMHYRSRTRGLWRKGETSGHTQRVVALSADCDRDVVLARVVPAGPSCHTGAESCFIADGDAGPGVAAELDRLVAARMARVPGSDAPAGYTDSLLADRNRRLKKLGEEAAELVMACADDDRARAIEEAADVLYHLLVAVRAAGGSWDDVCAALAARRRGR
ncbi:MAG: bifunctional phosphoribosyl-AMP cyclohydrolase/phosphoribosyl-ATP diphosphatase HisIE [Gemmatimonadales bacterium]